jgi:hypothetical protein
MPPKYVPYQRSDPKKLQADRDAIIKDLEQRLPPDSEDPESFQKRMKKQAFPRISGALVTGFGGESTSI